MLILAKRALVTALTVMGLVLLVAGLWFTVHLGTSGSATFRATPRGGVVVLEPSVLNRLNQPTTVSAVAGRQTRLWMGLASPSDVHAIVGSTERTEVTGDRLSGWSLDTSRLAGGPAPDLPSADIWHRARTGTGSAHLGVHQTDAPEAVVVATADGSPLDLHSVTVTVQRRAWFFQSALTALVGLLVTIAGGVSLRQLWRRQDPALPQPEPAAEEVRA